MKFKVKNNSYLKTYYALCGDMSGFKELLPQATITVDDQGKDNLIASFNGRGEILNYIASGSYDSYGKAIMNPVYGDPIEVLATAEDHSAPHSYTIAVSSTTWAMYDFKHYFSTFQFTNTGSVALEISMSGVVDSTTAPPAETVIPLAANETVTIKREMNLERYLLYRTPTTAGTLKVIVS